MFRAIDVRTKHTSFLCQFSDTCQRKHLKTAAISKDRALPSVETVQTACRFEHLQTWPEIQMIGVTEDNLCLDLFAKFAEMNSLYRPASAYWHKDWRFDLSVVGSDYSRTGV